MPNMSSPRVPSEVTLSNLGALSAKYAYNAFLLFVLDRLLRGALKRPKFMGFYLMGYKSTEGREGFRRMIAFSSSANIRTEIPHDVFPGKNCK